MFKFKCYSISTISFIYFITFLGLIQNFETIIEYQFDMLGRRKKTKDEREMWGISLTLMRELLKKGSNITRKRMSEICIDYEIRDQIMKTNVFVRHWNGSVSFDYRLMREFAKKEIEKAENS